jgi:hypothetical protein
MKRPIPLKRRRNRPLWRQPSPAWQSRSLPEAPRAPPPPPCSWSTVTRPCCSWAVPRMGTRTTPGPALTPPYRQPSVRGQRPDSSTTGLVDVGWSLSLQLMLFFPFHTGATAAITSRLWLPAGALTPSLSSTPYIVRWSHTPAGKSHQTTTMVCNSLRLCVSGRGTFDAFSL